MCTISRNSLLGVTACVGQTPSSSPSVRASPSPSRYCECISMEISI